MKILKMAEFFFKYVLSTVFMLFKHFRNTAPPKASTDATM